MPVLSLVKMSKRRTPQDEREQPLFNIADAAFYLGIRATTLRQWVWGRPYQSSGVTKFSSPLIKAADPRRGFLSFVNLAEAHVLQATRDREIAMPDVRTALTYIERQTGSKHPLITEEFFTAGKNLFIKRLQQIVNASKDGQIALDFLDSYLERVIRDDSGLPYRLFPMRANPERRVMVDLFIASAQPTIADTGILAEVIHGRFHSGETIAELAIDYDVASPVSGRTEE